MKNFLTRDKLPFTPREKRTHLAYALLIISIVVWTISSLMWLKEYNYNLGYVISEPITMTREAEAASNGWKVSSQTYRIVTAYNVGRIEQTDESPCISANGENICDAVEAGYKRCAANFVEFGTHLEIEGWGICMVTDRLNSRYPNRVDVAMGYDEVQEAINFGARPRLVKILK